MPSTWRPGHGSTCEKVHMKMGHGLSTLLQHIDHDAIPLAVESCLLRPLPGRGEESCDRARIGLIERTHVLPRQHEKVLRCHGRNVTNDYGRLRGETMR